MSAFCEALAEFERYAKLWTSLAAYEAYRTKSFADPECLAAFELAKRTNCIVSYERSFFRPVFD